MKVLFICSHDVRVISGGGSQCTNRNYLSLCKLLGAENVEIFQLVPGLQKSVVNGIDRAISYIHGFEAGLTKNIVNEVVALSDTYDIIFLDSSKYGVLSYHLKKNNFKGKIISFFHNVEHKVFLQKVKINPFRFWRSFIIYHNEKNAVKNSDKIIVLHNRDLADLDKIYNLPLPESYIVPISFKDKYPEHLSINLDDKTGIPPTCLFVGNEWFANIHGIRWFIDNVLDHVNVKLQIAGGASEALSKQITHPKIEFLGFVSDLGSVIMDSDLIVAPIFKGGGMKVKVCESLMYGKHIIGTKEAFHGYNIDVRKVGAICENKNEFIEALQEFASFKRKKFNVYNRNCFLNNYSFTSTLKIFNDVIASSDVNQKLVQEVF